MKITFPIHDIPSAAIQPPCLELKLFTPEFRRNLRSSFLDKLFLPTNTFRLLTFNQARQDLTAVLHVHMIHVHVVHLHVLIYRFGIWNLPQIALQLIIAGQTCQRP